MTILYTYTGIIGRKHIQIYLSLISFILIKVLVKVISVKMSPLLLSPNACICNYKLNYANCFK